MLCFLIGAYCLSGRCQEAYEWYVKSVGIRRWNEIAEALDKEGLEYEAHYARDNAKNCMDR